MQPLLVPRDEVHLIFPQVRQLLKRAIEKSHTSQNLHWLESQCASGKADLVVDDYANPKAAAVIRLEEWERPVLSILCFGARKGVAWPDAMAWAKTLAEHHGAVVRSIARTGFKRIFPDAKVIASVYEWS